MSAHREISCRKEIIITNPLFAIKVMDLHVEIDKYHPCHSDLGHRLNNSPCSSPVENWLALVQAPMWHSSHCHPHCYRQFLPALPRQRFSPRAVSRRIRASSRDVRSYPMAPLVWQRTDLHMSLENFLLHFYIPTRLVHCHAQICRTSPVGKSLLGTDNMACLSTAIAGRFH